MSDSENRPDENKPDDDIFDIARIRRLVELMEGHDLREIDLRQDDQRIRLCRGAEMAFAPQPATHAAATGPPAAPLSPAPSAAASNAATPPEPAEENIVIVKSPMVGTFYTRVNPSADPFVKIGDMVAPETTICIVEAMKVFNEIPAETRGKIVAVLADDEEPVDHGRPLFKVDTSIS